MHNKHWSFTKSTKTKACWLPSSLSHYDTYMPWSCKVFPSLTSHLRMSSIFRPYLFILFCFNFLQNCWSSADFHLLGVQDLAKRIRKEGTAALLRTSSSWRDGGGGGSPFRGTRKFEAAERPCDGARVTAASAVEILQASVIVPAHTCRASLDFPVSLQSPDNTFLLYAGDSFTFSHPPSVSANNPLFFPLLRSFLRALGKPETSGP
jgi:hypothetical protein